MEHLQSEFTSQPSSKVTSHFNFGTNSVHLFLFNENFPDFLYGAVFIVCWLCAGVFDHPPHILLMLSCLCFIRIFVIVENGVSPDQDCDKTNVDFRLTRFSGSYMNIQCIY